MKMNRKLVLILSLVLSLALATGGTLAYLSDTDADVNTMTLGNVHIEQHEYQRVMGSDGKPVTKDIDGQTSYVLEDFQQGKPLYPSAIPTNSENWNWDTIPVRMSQKESYGGMQTFVAGSNAQDKFVTVENTGKSDAYVRTLIAIEIGDADADLIGVSYHKTWESRDVGEIDIKGNKYVLIEYTYKGADLGDGTWRHQNGVLPAGDTTYPNLAQVYLSSVATNEDVEALDGNDNGMLDILVVSQAIQAAGFEDAKTALNTGFGVVSETSHPWLDLNDPNDENDQEPDGWPKDPVVGDDKDAVYEVPADAYRVTNAAELKAAVAAGETTLLLAAGEYDIDGCNGKNLTLVGEDAENTIIVVTGTGAGEGNGQLDYGFDSSTVTFQNLTIKTNNQTYAGYARLNATYKNVTFESCYCLNDDSQFENCTFNVAGDQYNVWTWGAPKATFTNCTFNSDGKAILLYGTANTKLTVNRCEFNDNGGLTDLKAAIEIGNDYNKSYELIVNDTVVNGYEVNDKGIQTGSTLWANKNSMGSDNLNVVIDGVDVY